MHRDRLLQFFACDHMPIEQSIVARPFKLLAEQIADELEANPERTVALRHLLDARDAALRAKACSEPERIDR